MIVTSIFFILISYYLFLPVFIGTILPDSRDDLFLCNGCGYILDDINFLVFCFLFSALTLFFIWISELKTSNIKIVLNSDPALSFIAEKYLLLASLACLLIAPFEISTYMQGEDGKFTKILYTLLQVFIVPSLFLYFAKIIKPSKIVIFITTLSLIFVLMRLKRLELFISILAISIALINNKIINFKKIFVVLGVLFLIGSVVGVVRSFIRGDAEVDYLGMVWEPSFVFRSFIATYDLNFVNSERIYEDLFQGLGLALPEFVRVELNIPDAPFDLTEWGGDDFIRPLGGHFFWAQFYQSAGWWGLTIPVLIFLIFIFSFGFIRKFNNENIVAVGMVLFAISLGSAFRDHFYYIFRIQFYWLFFWFMPYLVLKCFVKNKK